MGIPKSLVSLKRCRSDFQTPYMLTLFGAHVEIFDCVLSKIAISLILAKSSISQTRYPFIGDRLALGISPRRS